MYNDQELYYDPYDLRFQISTSRTHVRDDHIGRNKAVNRHKQKYLRKKPSREEKE